MPNANIILILLAVAIVLCIGGLSTAHFAAAKRRKELPREIGVVSVVMTSRAPGREQYQMSIMRHGRPMTTCVSMPCKKGSFRVGAKVPVAVETVVRRGVPYKIAYILQKS
ncbi:hypothetical protein [Intestinimonas massiliensis (ex Afouda et al. 2020)]|uniref:DUF3592 domain-containing protein n=1 Tax=Intestinimonas massiliensis (ex Afouda et al. 2020) TaxID=1673721 RepID=A0ABS9MDH2_9FIRM|nr:hypothetical protein [Intestinimonas massiliensis (ex Afouda et al. 2020)]MCG4528855.1 hypothetical protein [Intestinimonas massiliensis (ex Afouda et al. 2020)]